MCSIELVVEIWLVSRMDRVIGMKKCIEELE